MCICVCMVRIEWKVNNIWYYHFKIWCLHIIWANLWWRDLSCRETLAWIQRCSLVTSFTVFSSNSYMCFPCKYYAGFFSCCSQHTSTHFLIDWQPGVGILLLHINLCLLVLYLVSKLSCYLTCWVNTSSSWENHTCKSTASSGRVASVASSQPIR